MQTTTTPKNDPIALAAVVALLGLALFANLAHIGPPEAQAQNIIILQATSTPALPTNAPAPVMIELAQPTIAPILAAQDSPGQVEASAPIQIDVDPAEAAPADIPPTPDYAALQATEDARAQAAIDQAVNNPAQNGGNVAPEGCPFPIINGVCANGVLAKSVGESAFGSKSIADDRQPAGSGVPTSAPITDETVLVNPLSTHQCRHAQVWTDSGCKNPTPIADTSADPQHAIKVSP